MATKKVKRTRQVVEEEPTRGRRSPIAELTERQRTQLAQRVIRLREQGVPWDGPEGICAQEELITSATIGRKLLREYGGDDLIRESSGNGGGRATTKKASKKPAAKKAAKGKSKVVVRGNKRRANP